MLNTLLTRPQPLHCGSARPASSFCGVRVALSRARVVVKAAKDPFYNRTREVYALSRRLLERPSAITVITGPSNVGISAIVNKVIADAEITNKAFSSNARQIFMKVNCREGISTNPSAFAQLLGDQVNSSGCKLDQVDYMALAQNNFKQVQWDKAITQLESQSTTTLGALISFLAKWLQKYPSSPSPVIVIDEANRLRDWKEDHERDLQGLLDFLVTITEQGVCHVVLATSDGFLADWLQQKGVRQNQYVLLTIGDLTEDELKGYVYGRDDYPGLVNTTVWGKNGGFTLPESLWEAAYTRLGGSVGNWKVWTMEAAVLFKPASDEGQLAANLEQAWQYALEEPRFQAIEHTKRAFQPEALVVIRDEPKWTAQQWSTVLRSIKEAPHHAVSIASLLSKGLTEGVVESLLSYNFITLRSPSRLARDLPEEVYGQKQGKVVTAVDAAQLEYICSGDWDQVLQDVLALERFHSSPAPSRPPGVPGCWANRPPSPTSDAMRAVSDDIKAVEDKIEDIEKQIAEVNVQVPGIKAAKGVGWDAELADCQQERQLLMERKRQLRDKEKQLRDKKLLLLKREE